MAFPIWNSYCWMISRYQHSWTNSSPYNNMKSAASKLLEPQRLTQLTQLQVWCPGHPRMPRVRSCLRSGTAQEQPSATLLTHGFPSAGCTVIDYVIIGQLMFIVLCLMPPVSFSSCNIIRRLVGVYFNQRQHRWKTTPIPPEKGEMKGHEECNATALGAHLKSLERGADIISAVAPGWWLAHPKNMLVHQPTIQPLQYVQNSLSYGWWLA